MNSKISGCLMIKFQSAEGFSPDLTDFLDSLFEVSALNYQDDGGEEYVGYAPADYNIEALTTAANCAGIDLPPFKVEKLEDKNWQTENVIKFDPIETADFCVYGVHEKQAPKSSKHLLKIYAATAFGSGHQTTKCCLEAISALFKNQFQPRRILDMGTGSGILALACAKLWKDLKTEIVAVDIDYESVRVASQNAFDNHLEEFLQIAQSDGYASDVIQKNAPYDLILSNILARPLIEMSPQLSENLRRGGYCILSGFVDDQVQWVVEAHEKQGLSLIESFQIDNWHAVLMEKK